MPLAKSLTDYSRVDAVRLTTKRRFAKPGDIFRLSPAPGVILWGRVIKQGDFFGAKRMSLVYIYDVMSSTLPSHAALSPERLIVGPLVVNNLGWVRGYWDVVVSRTLEADDVREQHLFKSPSRTNDHLHWDIVDENGALVRGAGVDLASLSLAGINNFNFIDEVVRGILVERGMISDKMKSEQVAPADAQKDARG